MKHVSIKGEFYNLSDDETEVFYEADWREIYDDQDGEKYILSNNQTIYLDFSEDFIGGYIATTPIIKEVTPEQSHTPQAQETFEQFLSKNPYKDTRSFTKEDWESSMYDQWKEGQPAVQGDIVQGHTPGPFDDRLPVKVDIDWPRMNDGKNCQCFTDDESGEILLRIETTPNDDEIEFEQAFIEALANRYNAYPSLLRENKELKGQAEESYQKFQDLGDLYAIIKEQNQQQAKDMEFVKTELKKITDCSGLKMDGSDAKGFIVIAQQIVNRLNK